MAFYTNNTKTEILNSVFDQTNYRSEFRLTPGKLYLSNMRILNLGLTAAELGDGRYNLVNGVGSIIKNIFLYDGAVILDSVLNYADYGAFKSYNKTNQHNSDVSKVLDRSGLGFVYEKEPNEENGVANYILIKEAFPNAPHKPEVFEADTARGFLNLNEVFPLLAGASGLQFLHTGLFKNLRVVIEYNVRGSVVEAVPLAEKTTLPILVADFIDDGGVTANKVLSEFKQVNWLSVESESVSIPAPNDADFNSLSQSKKLRLTGVLGKNVNSILIQKKGSTHVSALYGNHGSETMIDETVQLFCNGSAVLPENGVAKPNERLALLHDTFKVMNSHTCSNELPVHDADNLVDGASDRCGRLDYFGCIINQKVNSLDLSYSRTVVDAESELIDPRYIQPLTLNIFYGVLKTIVKDTKGGYSVMYL